MAITQNKLQSKGWNKKEIDHTLNILKKAKTSPHRNISMERTAYILALIAGIASNAFVAAYLIPLIALNSLSQESMWLLYSITGILGLVFGILFAVLIKDLEHLQKKHHYFTIFFIPTIGFTSFILLLAKMHQISAGVILKGDVNTQAIAFIYTLLFIIPYALVLLGKGYETKNIFK